MTPTTQLRLTLESLADSERYLFTPSDLQGIFPERPDLSVLLSRAQASGLLRRVCRGLYLYPRVPYPKGRVLHHAAARLRAGFFNYISLESALSDAGVISQLPLNWLTLMSSGRSHVVDCGEFGRLEFVHTARGPSLLAAELVYDTDCRLWRASVKLAMRDMRATRRSLDLIDWEVFHELV